MTVRDHYISGPKWMTADGTQEEA